MNNKVFAIVGIILVAVAALSLSPATNKTKSEVEIKAFPYEAGEWKGEEIAVDEQVYQILDTRNLFVRKYVNSAGEAAYLYIVYSEDDRKVSHPPEVCMMGGGSTILEKTKVKMTETIDGNRLLVAAGTVPTELIVYWYKAGKFYTPQYLRQQVQTVIDRLMRRRTASAMIRVSALIKNNDEPATLELLRSFTRAIEPLLAQYIP